MSTLSVIFTVAIPVFCLAFSVFVGFRTMKKTGSSKRAFGKHFIALLSTLIVCFSFVGMVSAAEVDTKDATPAAQTEVAEEKSQDKGSGVAAGLGFVGAGLSIGLAAIGAGLALAGGAPAAIGATAENPEAFGKSMIFVALCEAVAIYGFIIAFLIVRMLPTVVM